MYKKLCPGPAKGGDCPHKRWLPIGGLKRCNDCRAQPKPPKVKPAIISEMRELVTLIRLKNTAKALMLLLCLSVGLQAYDGKVVGVSDGDTITVLDESLTQHKIRFYGIDAPEKKQAFGTAAKQHLSGLVFGKNVRVDVVNIDRYGRQVANIFYGPEDSANIQMIRDGYAWAYTQYIKGKENKYRYLDYEHQAKWLRRGLWVDDNPTPPWKFRRMKRK